MQVKQIDFPLIKKLLEIRDNILATIGTSEVARQ